MNLGVETLQTHLFVFYYAVLSAITPPVALAVFAAAAIAKVSPLKLAARALRLSLVAFVLPIVWVYHPEINLQDLNAETWLPTTAYILALLLAVIAATAGQIGYFKVRLGYIERALMLAGAAAIVAHETPVILTGVVAVTALLGFAWLRGARAAS